MEWFIEIVGAVIGIIFFICEYKAHVSMWWVGIVMALFYMYIYFTSGLYANAGLYCYNFMMSIYGLIVWKIAQKNGTSEENSLPIRRCPKKLYPPLILILVVLWAAVWALLLKIGNPDIPLVESWITSVTSPFKAFGDSASPVLDSLTTSLSMVAMWVLARKYIDHWYAWFIVNVVSAIMCFITGLYPAAAMFTFYTVGSVFAFLNWRRQLVKE